MLAGSWFHSSCMQGLHTKTDEDGTTVTRRRLHTTYFFVEQILLKPANMAEKMIDETLAMKRHAYTAARVRTK